MRQAVKQVAVAMDNALNFEAAGETRRGDATPCLPRIIRPAR